MVTEADVRRSCVGRNEGEFKYVEGDSKGQTSRRLISQLESDGDCGEDKALPNVGHDVGYRGGNVELWGRRGSRRLECDRGDGHKQTGGRGRGVMLAVSTSLEQLDEQ